MRALRPIHVLIATLSLIASIDLSAAHALRVAFSLGEMDEPFDRRYPPRDRAESRP